MKKPTSIFKIRNNDGSLWLPNYKSSQEAREDYKNVFDRYNAMLAGQPHEILEVINNAIRPTINPRLDSK